MCRLSLPCYAPGPSSLRKGRETPRKRLDAFDGSPGAVRQTRAWDRVLSVIVARYGRVWGAGGTGLFSNGAG
jgi:hypothetical protein